MVTDFYRKYLRSPQWQAKREAWFAKNGRWCRGCRRTHGPLQLHHITYERLGREALSDLTALCPKCHNEVKKLHYRMGRRTPGHVVFQRFLQMKRLSNKRR